VRCLLRGARLLYKGDIAAIIGFPQSLSTFPVFRSLSDLTFFINLVIMRA